VTYRNGKKLPDKTNKKFVSHNMLYVILNDCNKSYCIFTHTVALAECMQEEYLGVL